MEKRFINNSIHFLIRRHLNKEESSKACNCSEPVHRSIMYHQGFLYASNETGCHLAKIGSGYQETLPGYVYSRTSQCLESGLFVEINGTLLHRPISFDNSSDNFGYTLDSAKLNRKLELTLSKDLLFQRGEIRTIALLKLSGNVMLWIRQVSSDTEMLSCFPQAHITVADFCSVSIDTQPLVSLVKRKFLLKNPESTENIDRMSTLLRTSKKTQQHDQANSDDDIQVKFPADGLSSSCGLRLTTLQESAFTNCDGFLTVLAPNPDCRGKSSSKILGYSY